MQITAFFFFFFLSDVWAFTDYPQDTKLTLKMENVRLIDVLDAIEKKSEFHFIFNQRLIDVERRVNINFRHQSIDYILKYLFKDTDVRHQISDKQVVLTTEKNIIGEQSDQNTKRAVYGKVTDALGMPLQGVSLVIKGTNEGTITDFNGNFTLKAIPANSVIQFSFVGMKTKEVSTIGKSYFNVLMEESAIRIQEVVAIGYGFQKRKDLTASISSLSGDDLTHSTTSSFDNAMQGRLAGVQVTQSTGAPGGSSTIRIRGFGSISASNEPLYVIDGFPFDNTANEGTTGYSASSFSINPLSMFDPNDIESIDVLKDAAASSIYGSRGANGVVIITTKKGKGKKPTIDLSHYTGWQSATNLPELMNAKEYLEMMVDARNNAWVDGDHLNRTINDPDNIRNANFKVDPFKTEPIADTDWLDEIFRTSLMSNYSLVVRGGTDQINYVFTGGYLNQDGIIIGSGFKRYSFRANFDVKASEKLSFGFNVAPSFSEHDRARTEAKGNFVQGSVIHTAISARPSYPVYNEDGSLFNHRAAGTPPYLSNPVYIASELNENVYISNIVSNLYAKYDFNEHLNFKISFGGNLNNVRNHQFVPKSVHWPPTEGQTGQAYSYHSQSLNWLNENALNYTQKIDNHDFSILLGYTQQAYSIDRMDASTRNFADNNIQTISAGTQINTVSQRIEEWSLVSYLARLSYNFKDKYLMNVTTRADGSSRFGSNTKFGYFPSASFGWRFTEEEFLSERKIIDDGKLRISYGVTGNNSIGNYSQYTLLSNTRYVLGANQTTVTGLAPGNIGNDELGWETVEMINFGTDLYLLNNRLKLTGEYYFKNTRNLLLSVPIPSVTGFTIAISNSGVIKNWGWEFILSSKNIDKAFKWTTDINLSSNKNKIISLGGAGSNGVLLIAPNIYGVGDILYNEEGKPFSQFYGWVTDGIFQTEEEVLQSLGSQPAARPGDYKFVDINKDGVIDPDDRTIIGSALPDLIYGLNNQISYKNFELSIFLQGVYGGDIFNVNKQALATLGGTANQLKAAVNRWRSPENPGDGFYSRANYNDYNMNSRFSDRWIEDGSYLRVKNLTFAYNFSPKLLRHLGLKSTRLYVQGNNLFTITNYSGFDPEVSFSNGDPLMQGLDWSVYPISKTYTVGVNLSF